MKIIEPSLQNEIEALNTGQLPESGHWAWVPSSVNARVAARNAPPLVFYKAFLERDRLEKIKALFRGSRCKRAVENTQKLKAAGFNVPKVLLSDTTCREPWMVTEAVDAIGYGDFMASYLRRPTTAKVASYKHALVREVGKLAGQLHSQGIVHGDLRPNNILVEASALNPVLSLIDNERNAHYRNVPMKLVYKNLVQITMLFTLDLNAAARVRFYKAYFEAYQRFDSEQQKDIMLNVHNRVQARLSKKSIDKLVNANCNKTVATLKS